MMTTDILATEKKCFVSGVEEKYSYDVGSEGFAVEIYVPKSANGRKDNGGIQVPQELSLVNFAITNAGEGNKISSLCKHVTLLDLSENLLQDWPEVFKILDQLPVCSFLNLRLNPLCQHIDNLECSNTSYPKMEKLVLNELNLSWQTVTLLLELFPNLSEVHLSVNNYNTVELPEDKVFDSISSLHFNKNHLSLWTEMSKLGKAFPNLKNLVLLHNPLEELPTAGEACKFFPNLKCLNISNTNISSWTEVVKLTNFPKLTDVRMQGLQFLEDYGDELRRQLILAFLSNISRLNGGSISETEKDKAERVFIRHYAERDDKPQRYYDLEAKHGKVEALAVVNLRVKKTSNVTVKFRSQTFSTVIENKWTVMHLKRHLQSQIGLPANQMRIWHEESDGYITSLEELLSSSLPVSRYNVQDGDELIVDEKAVESIKETLSSN